MVGLKEELQTAHAEISRLQREADVRVLARATTEGGQQPNKRGASHNNMHLEIKTPPNEPRSSGEVCLYVGESVVYDLFSSR